MDHTQVGLLIVYLLCSADLCRSAEPMLSWPAFRLVGHSVQPSSGRLLRSRPGRPASGHSCGQGYLVLAWDGGDGGGNGDAATGRLAFAGGPGPGCRRLRGTEGRASRRAVPL